MSLGRDLLHRQDVIVRSFEATAPWSLLVKAASAAIMQQRLLSPFIGEQVEALRGDMTDL